MTRHEPTGESAPGTPAASAPLDSGLGFLTGPAHRKLPGAWEHQIADLGLTPPQAAMLRAVCEWPGSGLRELARRTHSDPMNAKRLADHLEQAGLIRSDPDPAHRQRRVLDPTELGLAVAAQVAARAAVWERRLSDLIGAEDVARLKLLLARAEQVIDSLSREPGHDPAGIHDRPASTTEE